MVADCYNVVIEHKTIGAVMRDKENVPAVLRRALDCMKLATQDVFQHRWSPTAPSARRQCLRRSPRSSRHIHNAEFSQQKHATFLLARSESEDPDFSLEVEHPDLGILGDMMRKQADDPVGALSAAT